MCVVSDHGTLVNQYNISLMWKLRGKQGLSLQMHENKRGGWTGKKTLVPACRGHVTIRLRRTEGRMKMPEKLERVMEGLSSESVGHSGCWRTGNRP